MENLRSSALDEWDFGIVTFSNVDADGFSQAQVSLDGGKGGHPAELHYPYGYYAQPPEPEMKKDGSGPDPSKACQALYAFCGDELHVWPIEDPRAIKKLPNLLAGENVLYGPKGQVIRHRADGSTVLFVTAENGQSTWLSISPTALEYHAPWGKITFGYDGFHLRHSADGKTPGARIDLGGIFGAPPPLDSITSYIRMQAGMISQKAAVVATQGGGDTAVRSTENAALMNAFLTAIGAAFTASGAPTSAAAVSALTTFATAELPALLLAQTSASAVM